MRRRANFSCAWPIVGALVVTTAAACGNGDEHGVADASDDAATASDTSTALADADPEAANDTRADSSIDAALDADATDAGETRDPLKWPFSVDSIWNTPIGDAARYVPAGLKRDAQTVISFDEDIIVMHPTAPLVDVFDNVLPDNGQWSGPALQRCTARSPAIVVLHDVPIPFDFVYGPKDDKDTVNAGLAALRADGHTIVQSQPFSRCTLGGAATTGRWADADQDLYGPGTFGAHGGSGLSAIGGTLRVGELRPDPDGKIPHVRHALKIEVDKPLHLFRCDTSFPSGGTCGVACNCRWPAKQGESNVGAGTTNSALRFGALLAIPTSVDLAALDATLNTEPARALAWTLQNYGAYVVDDTAWDDAYAFATERGPDGSFHDQFASDWKFPFGSKESGASSEWLDDMELILESLQVVDDNSATSVGGAGKRLQPPAPPFAK